MDGRWRSEIFRNQEDTDPCWSLRTYSFRACYLVYEPPASPTMFAAENRGLESVFRIIRPYSGSTR